MTACNTAQIPPFPIFKEVPGFVLITCGEITGLETTAFERKMYCL